MNATELLIAEACDILRDLGEAPRVTIWRIKRGWRATAYIGDDRIFGNGDTPDAAIAYLLSILQLRKADHAQ